MPTNNSQLPLALNYRGGITAARDQHRERHAGRCQHTKQMRAGSEPERDLLHARESGKRLVVRHPRPYTLQKSGWVPYAKRF
jgi:hypothetical protein